MTASDDRYLKPLIGQKYRLDRGVVQLGNLPVLRIVGPGRHLMLFDYNGPRQRSRFVTQKGDLVEFNPTHLVREWRLAKGKRPEASYPFDEIIGGWLAANGAASFRGRGYFAALVAQVSRLISQWENQYTTNLKGFLV